MSDLHEIFREVWQWTSDESDHRLYTGTVFRIHQYWETTVRKNNLLLLILFRQMVALV